MARPTMMKRIAPLVRFLLAWAITLGVLVYCWGCILALFWMLTGRPEWFIVAGLAAGVLVVGMLTCAWVRCSIHVPGRFAPCSWAGVGLASMPYSLVSWENPPCPGSPLFPCSC